MKNKIDYIQDIAEIRSMMERSSKFLSLSGWAGVFAGLYALTGAFFVFNVYDFNPDKITYSSLDPEVFISNIPIIIGIALLILALSLITAIFFSYKKAVKRSEKLWNSAAKRLLLNMLIPLVTGGILILIIIKHGLFGLIAPLTLLFYGLALYNASIDTYNEIKILGLIEIILGLAGLVFIEYGLLIWAIGFGVVHIVYGIIIQYKYKK
jgi:hypothetical protein